MLEIDSPCSWGNFEMPSRSRIQDISTSKVPFCQTADGQNGNRLFRLSDFFADQPFKIHSSSHQSLSSSSHQKFGKFQNKRIFKKIVQRPAILPFVFAGITITIVTSLNPYSSLHSSFSFAIICVQNQLSYPAVCGDMEGQHSELLTLHPLCLCRCLCICLCLCLCLWIVG